jgi:hypothetical protein
MSNDLKHIDNLSIEEGDTIVFDDDAKFTVQTIDRASDKIGTVMEDADITGPTTFEAKGIQEALVNGEAFIDGKDLDTVVKHY